ncbi:MAG: hypothetical protein J7604_14935 [Sporocytophaga sp.]|uniref:hypothetical protein n=1 Tax=Sporocytophaga sp. TaxID=2231183 RepID=UPI001B10B4B6|nr:hypothetical protein [Sporocytophaga sp.]MBO9701503.1 hypothetical protein [Sporocytophaga sp.]
MNLLSKKTIFKTELTFIIIWTLSLLILSVVFSKERIILVDTSHYLLTMMENNTFYIATNRYISIFSQFLPFFAFNLHLSLSAILISYSVNFFLIPLVLIFLSIWWFKETKTAISILAFYSIMNSYLFFYPVSEFQIGLCVLLFYNGLYNHYNTQNKHFIIFIISSLFLISVIIFSHPLTLLIFILWSGLKYYELPERRNWIPSILLAALVNYNIRETLFKSNYDQRNIEKAGSLKNFGLHSFTNETSNNLWTYLQSEYFYTLIIVLAIICGLLYLRKYALISMFVFSLGSFYILYLITRPAIIYDFYCQHLFQPLTFIIALFFGQYATTAFKISKFYPIILSMIFVFPIYFICRDSIIIKQRHAFFQNYLNFMDKNGISKAIISRDNAKNIGNPELFWASPDEALLLSSLDGNTKSKLIYVAPNINEINHNLHSSDIIFYDTWNTSLNVLPSEYFAVSKKSTYIILEKEFGSDIVSNLSLTDR